MMAGWVLQWGGTVLSRACLLSMYSSGKKAWMGKIPKEPLLGWLELWAAVEIRKRYKVFNDISGFNLRPLLGLTL